METLIDLRERESVALSVSSERTDYAMAVVQEVKDGNADAKQVLVFAKKAQEIFSLIEKNVRPIVLNKGVQKGGLELFNGTKIVEKKDPDKYDFTACKDPVWESLNAKIEKLTIERKERENFLKTVKKPMVETEGDFAGVEFYPPSITHGAQNIAVTLA